MVKKARAAGQFLGGILNNPAVVILGGLAIVLLIFRGNISQAFADLGKNISGGLGDINIQLPSFELPSFEFPELPSFELPTFEFPELPSFEFPELPDFAGLFSGFQEQFNNLFTGGARNGGGGDFTDVGMAGARGERGGAPLPEIPLRDIADDIEGLTPAQSFAFIERGVIPTGFQVVDGVLVREMQAAPIPADPFSVSSFLLQEPLQTFTGGGVSFEGGAIFETPIENLSLSQIIDKGLAETASQAANLRAIAQGFTPEEEAFLAGSGDVGGFSTGFNPPAVSDPQFAGLTPEEIALRLTGGNISNF